MISCSDHNEQFDSEAMKTIATRSKKLSNFSLLRFIFLGLMMAFISSFVFHSLPAAYGASDASTVTVYNLSYEQHSEHTSGDRHQDCVSQMHCHMQAIVGSPTQFDSQTIQLASPVFLESPLGRAHPPISPPPKD